MAKEGEGAALKEAPKQLDEQPRPKARQLEVSRIGLAEHVRQVHVVTAFADTQPDDLLDPEYWAHVTAKLQAWDLIEVRADNGTWWAEYLVLVVERAFAHVSLLRKIALAPRDGIAKRQPAGYEVRHRGPASKWSVIRLSDSMVVQEGLNTQAEADTWLTNHLKAFK